ncbi:hypothetical protein CYMTET_49024 [Cymbomonas tetramitiformis]|uniref:Glycosyltransferase 2-like domain-containing protein n=1 Tax=Cymbomonas tetramitiformis TaxID=36881 RepID=A0AAE0BS49_9CHLO|nr:hypothetical protein CYMTET_49024 [Cymbomonas tetramitiformis]
MSYQYSRPLRVLRVRSVCGRCPILQYDSLTHLRPGSKYGIPRNRVFLASEGRRLQPALSSTRTSPSKLFRRQPTCTRSSATPATTEEYFQAEGSHGQDGVWSVVIPTYNRLPILLKCLKSLGEQTLAPEFGLQAYEVVVVDDGSSDSTVETLEEMKHDLPHVRLIVQSNNEGAAVARNVGVKAAKGDTIVFIDSDMVVVSSFLYEHASKLHTARGEFGDDLTFSYGRVINTDNFEDPCSEPFKLSDSSAAFFATGNVALSRRCLMAAARSDATACCEGPFDTEFSEYGWEDLELGERLRQQGTRIVQCPTAAGYHYHPAFTVDQIPALISQERQRGRNGARFFLKHPNLGVRLMVQLTPLHYGLWFLLTLGGLLNEDVWRPLVGTPTLRCNCRLGC